MLTIKQLKEDFEYPDAVTVDFQNDLLFIKQYLPVEKKYIMIRSVIDLLKLDEEPYNPIMGEILFDLNLVEEYSNILFENEDHADFFKTYDVLQCLGLIDIVIENIPKEEFDEIKRLYEEYLQMNLDYNKTISAAIPKALSSLLESPGVDDLENIDMSKYENVLGLLGKLGEKGHI